MCYSSKMVAVELTKYSFVTSGFYVPKDASFRDCVCSDETCFSKRDLPLSRSFVAVVAVFDEIKGQLFIIREVLDI